MKPNNMPHKKQIIFDATLFVDAYETQLFRTGLYRVSEQLLNQILQLSEYDVWLYDTMGRERIMRQYIMPNYPTLHMLSFENSIYVSMTDYILERADVCRIKQLETKSYVQKKWYQFLKNAFRLYADLIRKCFPPKSAGFSNKNAHYLATYYPIPQWVHSNGLKATLIIHDLIPIAHPEWFPTDANKHTLESIVYSVTKNDQVVCVSESTRNDLLAYRADLLPEQVNVAHLAGADVFKPTPLIDALRKRIGIVGEYILSVCTLEPRKNLQLVVSAYEYMLQQSSTAIPQLVLVGAIGWKSGDLIQQIVDLNARYANSIIITGYINDEELAQLYTGATMFVYPSLYEGFGLPPLEAMQCGCPVITSEVSSLPEVVGNAGLTIEPTNMLGLVEAINEMLKNIELYRKSSLVRAKEFSWTKMTKQVMKTIKI